MEAVGLATGIIGGIGKLFGRGKANKKLDQLQKQDPTYAENPLARNRLGLAQTLLNARMPGASTVEKNIYGAGANAFGRATANATDSSQLLAMGSAIQGQQAQQFSDLGVQEAQNYQSRYGNLVNAQQGVINEGDKVFDDQIRKFGNKMQIQGAKNQNNQNNWGDISRLGFGLADYANAKENGREGGGGGMFSGLFGRNGGGQYQPTADDISGMQRMPYNPQKLPF